MPHLSGDVAKLAFAKVWSSLEITFLYESFLLELRHIAFEGKSHLCEIAALMLAALPPLSYCIICVHMLLACDGVGYLWGGLPP